MMTNTTTGTDTYTQDGDNAWVERSLYGGTIACRLPTQLRDISIIRQVPDEQECYQGIIHTNTHNNSNESEEGNESLFVMEILEQQVDVDNEHIVEYLFNDLAESNGCSINDVVETATSNVPSTNNNEDRPRILYFRTENDDPVIRISPPTRLLTSTNMESMMEIDNDDTNNNTNIGHQSTIVYRSGCGLQRLHPGKDHINPSTMENVFIQLFVIRLPTYRTDILITLSTPITNGIANEIPPGNEEQQLLQVIFQQIISSIQIRDVSLFDSS